MKHFVLILTILATMFTLSAFAVGKNPKSDYDKALALHQQKQYKKALPLFSKLAQTNDPQALYYTGYYHEKGLACDTDLNAAIECYKKILALQNPTLTALYTNDLQSIAKVLLPPGKDETDINKQFSKIYDNSERSLSPEEFFEFAVCREICQNNPKYKVPQSTSVPAVRNLYQRAAGEGYHPAQYRLAQMYENGINVDKKLATAAEFYRWSTEQFLDSTLMQYPLRIVASSSSLNTMMRRTDGKPNVPRISGPYIYEVEEGMNVNGFKIVMLTSKAAYLESFMEYLAGGQSNTRGRRFILERGETATYHMMGVTDVSMSTTMQYLK